MKKRREKIKSLRGHKNKYVTDTSCYPEKLCDCNNKLFVKLKRENIRLKQALKQIADGDIAPSSIGGYLDEAYQEIARIALGQNK